MNFGLVLLVLPRPGLFFICDSTLVKLFTFLRSDFLFTRKSAKDVCLLLLLLINFFIFFSYAVTYQVSLYIVSKNAFASFLITRFSHIP